MSKSVKFDTNTSENADFSTCVELGIKIGAAISDEGNKRVIDHFLKNGNKPSYHNQIFRKVRGSKTTVSKALHILSNEYELLTSGYVQIPQGNPPNRMVSVLMFQIKDEYLDLFKQYITYFKK